jgi:hypothetical protein
MTELKQLEQGIGFELYEAIDIFSNYSRERGDTTTAESITVAG